MVEMSETSGPSLVAVLQPYMPVFYVAFVVSIGAHRH